jgi:hypothetical protein
MLCLVSQLRGRLRQEVCLSPGAEAVVLCVHTKCQERTARVESHCTPAWTAQQDPVSFKNSKQIKI